jgi:hypothetical protein
LKLNITFLSYTESEGAYEIVMKKIKIPKPFIKSLSLVLCLLLSYCGVKEARLKDNDISGHNISYSIYKTISYDKYHRPVIADKIERPTKDKEQFHIVASSNNTPVRSYDILVKDIRQTFDPAKPFKLIFEWTGKGVKKSGKLIGINLEPDKESHKPTLEMYYPYPFDFIPPGAFLIGGTVGFFIGIYKGIIQLPKELTKVVVEGKEIMLGYTEYYYDQNGRLALIKYFVPYERINNYKGDINNKTGISYDKEQASENGITEIFQIQYYYSKKSVNPYKTIITEKVPELKEKEILF